MAKSRVASTAIVFIDYDDERQSLTINFSDGTTYTYAHVPPYVYSAFLVAPSKGGFYNRTIRNSYPFSRG